MITDSYDVPLNFGGFLSTCLHGWRQRTPVEVLSDVIFLEKAQVGFTYPAPHMILASRELRMFPREKTSAYTDVPEGCHAK